MANSWLDRINAEAKVIRSSNGNAQEHPYLAATCKAIQIGLTKTENATITTLAYGKAYIYDPIAEKNEDLKKKAAAYAAKQ
jgi:hypothetical protein